MNERKTILHFIFNLKNNFIYNTFSNLPCEVRITLALLFSLFALPDEEENTAADDEKNQENNGCPNNTLGENR